MRKNWCAVPGLNELISAAENGIKPAQSNAAATVVNKTGVRSAYCELIALVCTSPTCCLAPASWLTLGCSIVLA
jgi:hypothetical protein